MAENDTKYSEIEILLSQIEAIKGKNDSVLKATGGNYNIFRVLGVGNDELIFSRMIAHLLNVNASHGMGTTFLKLFIKKLSSIVDIPFNLKYEKATVYTEYDIGKRIDDGVGSTGGRLDIFIEIPSDKGVVCFIIENKIYADDQNCQLRRYKNFADKNYYNRNYILYLTLNGYSPSIESTQIKDNKEQFWYEISYSYFIKEWIEDCVKKSSDFPYLRESLKQFLNQIKRLTGQDFSQMAEEEIINLLSNNLELVGEIYRNAEKAKYKCAKKNIETFFFENYSKLGYSLEFKNFTSDINKNKKAQFIISKNNWRNFKIKFYFEQRGLHNLKYGIAIIDPEKDNFFISKHPEIIKEIQQLIVMDKGADSTKNWVYIKYSDNQDFQNWYYKTIKSENNIELIKYLKECTDPLLEKMELIEKNFNEYLTKDRNLL